MLEALRQDVWFAARSLAKARAFSSIVIVTLALGIGANTAVFSVLHAAVLRPLPYPGADELVRVYLSYRGEPNYLPGPAAADLLDHSRTVDLAITYTYATEGVDLTDRAQPERAIKLTVGATYFRVLGVTPIRGAAFDAADERKDANVAIISARIWREYFGGADEAIGKLIAMDGISRRVVGVMPDGFDDPIIPGVEIWTPLDMQDVRAESWRNNYLSAIGRLRPGSTLRSARAELSTLVAAEQTHYGGRDARQAMVVPLKTDTLGSSARLLWILQGAVALLLLIACVNVASVFLARGAARQSELAVRRALGCPQRRLVSEFLIEGVMLASAGAAAGLLLAATTSRALLASAPVALPGSHAEILDIPVFLFTCAVACCAGLAFGVAPALRFGGSDVDAVLREEGRGSGGSARETRARGVLVVSQVAVALVLLIGAGLLLRTFTRLQSVDIGITPDNVLTFAINLPGGRYADPLARARFHEDFERRVGRVPGVRFAGAVSRLPLTGPYHVWNTGIPDGTGIPEGAQQRVISGDYFAAMGIPLLRGRLFGSSDDEKVPRRVVISKGVADRLFPSDDPVGRVIRAGSDTDLEIIGVVGDVPVTYRTPPSPTVYHLHRQFAANRNWALVQVVSLDPLARGAVDAIARELAAIDPALVLYQPRMLRDAVGGGLAQERFALFLVGLFAALAVVLAAIGLYGVLSYSVAQRHREIGIRLALGAPAASVRRLILKDAGMLAVTGIVIGTAVAAIGTRLMESLLYRTSATDPSIFAGAAVLLAFVAVAASWIPGRMAQRVDPLEVFRHG
jgi:putative ABC transport system permease protein